MNLDIISVLLQVVMPLIEMGALDKDKLPKWFPTTEEEFNDLVKNTANKSIEEYINNHIEVVDEWD